MSKHINYEGIQKFVELESNKITTNKGNIIKHNSSFPIINPKKDEIYEYNRLKYKCLIDIYETLEEPDNRFELINVSNLNISEIITSDKYNIIFGLKIIDGIFNISSSTKIIIDNLEGSIDEHICGLFKNENNTLQGNMYNNTVSFSKITFNNLPSNYTILYETDTEVIIQNNITILPKFIKSLFIIDGLIDETVNPNYILKNISIDLNPTIYQIPDCNSNNNCNFGIYNKTSTDFPLINNSYYEIIDQNNHYICFIDEADIIYGDNIQNISGKIRVKNISTPYKLRILRNDDNSYLKDMNNFMSKYYPSIYKDLKHIHISMIPDTSNISDFSNMFSSCSSTFDFPKINTSNGTNFSNMYSGTYSNVNQAKELPVLDTSNGINFSGMYNGCLNVLHFPLIDTSQGTNFSGMYSAHEGTRHAISYPKLNTSNGINFSNMYGTYGRSQDTPTEFPEIDTSKGIDFSYMYKNCTGGIIFPSLNTSFGRNFVSMYEGCKNVVNLHEIDLSNITYNTFNTKLLNMFSNCTNLSNVTFNNVPINISESNFREITKLSETCNLVINYREIKQISPIRVLKAENMKLVDIDVNGDMPIIRDGNKPLDEYIVNSGDWGTIYDDGKDFRCFITKDNKIYCGKGYNNTNRDPSYQSEIPEGIEVPNGNLTIEMGKFEKVGDFSAIGVGIEKYVDIRFFRFLSVFISAPISDQNIDFIYNRENGIFDCIARGNLNGQRIYETGTKENPDYYGTNRLGGQYIEFANYQNRTPQAFKQINIYEGTPFWEELESELEKIKGGN